jgi:hypothetical protein
MTSYASRNPYVTSLEERRSSYGLEWDRRLLTTLGVANGRLYEMRIQTANGTWDASAERLTAITDSFRVKEVEPL